MSSSLTGSYVRALFPKRPAGAWVQAGMERAAVAVDVAALARYRRLCGFAPDGPVPATFPHLTAFPLAMALMTRRRFPFPVLGLIHLANEIEQLEPMSEDQRLGYRVWIEKPREHPKGAAFDVLAEAHDAGDGRIVWRATSTYLRREKSPAPDASTARQYPVVPPPSDAERWPLPADLGRAYAAISGDRNPIHLYPATARPFGYRHPIAHGMWTAARCLAALAEPDPPDRFRLRVEFHAAVPLPSTVLFHATRMTGIRDFSLASADSGRRHLHGDLAPI
ncbi:MaoC family dehydratase [Actinospica robiniae]|uniref:MaoC family dehydratase n=1 Tax=Actinospica robiniae TaxID=304901 RepID=UPI000413CA34|nr:MaoC/PaaZ C-terminal domain-containing protein [Actinospica robiniae]